MQHAVIEAEKVLIEAEGAWLAGRLHRPAGEARAIWAIHGATGAPQSFYQPFARWLAAERGALVLTYDYRDFGASAFRPLAASDATMADWGARDQDAALGWALRELPGLPIHVVGHSLGGFMTPFHRNAGAVERLVAVASGRVHWTQHSMSYLPQVAAFWWLVGPAATAALGYLPGKRIGLGADLPAGVYWQWRRWCTSRGYFAGDPSLPPERPEAFRGDLRLVGFADDATIPPALVHRLADSYPAARSTDRLTLDPAAFGLKAIGHLGAFAARNAALWPVLID